jgi:predicted RNase H-like HicB family nuclease
MLVQRDGECVVARVCWKMQTNYEEELRRMGEDRDIERREDTAGCYTCGAAVGSEHVSGCPRAAWGPIVDPLMVRWTWRPTEAQESERMLRNYDARVATVERADDGTFSAFTEKMPGCVVTGAATEQEARERFAEAAAFHRAGVAAECEGGDGLPPVAALIGPVDADAFAKLEAVAARAAHCAVINTGPGMTGWAQAEYVENEVRAALRAFVSPPAGSAVAAQGPDLVSRMIDAHGCLRAAQRTYAGSEDAQVTADLVRGVAGALRWLDEGIEEGLMLRESHAAMRAQLSAEPHVCSCGHSRSCEGCSVGFEDRCRFEKALRTVLGASS